MENEGMKSEKANERIWKVCMATWKSCHVLDDCINAINAPIKR